MTIARRMSRWSLDRTLTRRRELFLFATALLTCLLVVPAASGQNCTWGGPSQVAPPEVSWLGSQDEGLRSPARLTSYQAGSLLVTEPATGSILMRDASGVLVPVKDGLQEPVAIAVDPFGTIYVGEAGTGSVSAFDAQWNRLFQLGTGPGEFGSPNDIAIDPNPRTASIYVADGDAHRVRVYSLSGEFQFNFGRRGSGPGELDFPSAIHVRYNRRAGGPLPLLEVFVADQNNDRVQVFDRQGNFLWCFGGNGGQHRFGRISGITSDTSGRLYISDAFQGWIRVFDWRGVALSTIGGFGQGPAELRTPMGLVIDEQSRLSVASYNNGRLEVFGLGDVMDARRLDSDKSLREQGSR